MPVGSGMSGGGGPSECVASAGAAPERLGKEIRGWLHRDAMKTPCEGAARRGLLAGRE